MKALPKSCPAFRTPESIKMGKGIGYCDLDGYCATCEGDVEFCEKPGDLARFLRDRAALPRRNAEGSIFPS